MGLVVAFEAHEAFSMRIAPAVCRRLALVDPTYRYGVGVIPGHGQTFFLAKLVNGDKLRRAPQDRPLATLAWDLKQRLIAFYDADGQESDAPPGWVPFLMSWPGQAGGNQWVTSGNHATWLEYNQVPIQQIAEDVRLGAIQNGMDMGSAVEDASDYAVDQTEFHDRHNWQTDTTDRTVTREELRSQAEATSRPGRAIRRLRRTLDGLNVKEQFVHQLLWEQGMAIKPKF
jgi:hypothetical protein